MSLATDETLRTLVGALGPQNLIASGTTTSSGSSKALIPTAAYLSGTQAPGFVTNAAGLRYATSGGNDTAGPTGTVSPQTPTTNGATYWYVGATVTLPVPANVIVQNGSAAVCLAQGTAANTAAQIPAGGSVTAYFADASALGIIEPSGGSASTVSWWLLQGAP